MIKFVRPEECKAKLVSSRELAPTIWSYIFEVTEGNFKFEAGQFTNVRLEDPDNPGEIIQRAYSFASAPDKNKFELCIELIENGKGSRYFDALEVGEEIDFKTPFGFCNLDPENRRNLLMVATGTGIAPMKSLLEDLASKEDIRTIDLFFGVRHEENLFYQKELEELKSKLKGLNVRLCLSQPLTEDWHGETGRVTHNLENYDFNESVEVFICGGEAMIKEVRGMVLDAGVDRKQIHVEIFDV
jgi:ferredoxin-NADP reductase